MRLQVVGLYLLGLGVLVGCTDAVPIKFPEDGRVFSGVWTGSVFDNPQPLKVLAGGNRIVVIHNQELVVLDAATGQQISRLGDFSGRVMGVSSDGSRVFELTGRELRVREAASLQVSQAIGLGNEDLQQISGDGSRYLTSSSNSLTVRNIADGLVVRAINASSGEALLSSRGQYLLTVQYTSGQPSYSLWNLATGSSNPLTLPAAASAQLSPPPPELQLRNLEFSPDDGRLVGVYTDFRQNQQKLLVWNPSSNTLEATLNLPSASGSSRDITLTADGSSGELFIVSAANNGLRYLSLPWTLQGVGQIRDVTGLFSSFFKSNIAPNEVIPLVAPEAYLLSYLELEARSSNPNGPPEAAVFIKANGLARVGTSAWNYRRETPTQQLRLEVQTQFVSTSEYTISGTATLSGQNYSVLGRGNGGGVRFFGGVEGQAVSPTLSISLELTSPTGQKSQLFATQYVSNSQSNTPPRYTGTFTSSTGSGLRVELGRP